MFGVSAFINYTIAVAVRTRFCFHVFLMWSCVICVGGCVAAGIINGRFGGKADISLKALAPSLNPETTPL
jgi:hypothetical protein